jgi:hypothetical protein
VDVLVGDMDNGMERVEGSNIIVYIIAYIVR